MKRLLLSLVIPLVLLILLSHRVNSQNMVVGNALPCGVDNLSCLPNGCLNTTQLCDETEDCPDGLDEGVALASLNCKQATAVSCSY